MSEDCENFPEFDYIINKKLSNIYCNVNEVEKLLKNLNAYKSPGPDDLPPHILKECAPELSSPLSTLINKSFSTFSTFSTSHLCSKRDVRAVETIIARFH